MFKLRYAAGNRAASSLRTPLATSAATSSPSATWQMNCGSPLGDGAASSTSSTSSGPSQQRRFNSSGGSKDYYKILGVSKESSPQDIKKAYRKKAMTSHPDQGGNSDEFAAIAEAYEVLSNDDKKRVYDQYGSEAAQQGGFPGGGGGGMGGRSPEDIFSEFFGGGMGGMGGMGGGRRQQKVEDIDVKIRLTLEEVYSGVTKPVRVSRPTLCSECRGKGTKSGEEKPKCTSCKGQGRVVRTVSGGGGIFQQVMSTCEKCSGSGSTAKAGDMCGKCNGDGYRTQPAEVSIPIPAGCPSAAVLQAPGEGGVIPGAVPGNLNLHIEMIEHRVFRRRGNDLLMDMELSFAEAMMGFERTVKLPDGRSASVHSPKGELLQTSSVLRLQGEGLPPTDGGPRGDIYVMVKVKMPKTLTDEQRKALEAAFGKGSTDSHATTGNTLQARVMKESKEELEAKKASTWARQEGGGGGGGGGGRRGGGGGGGGGAQEAQCAHQ